jgi:hypothetical protein
MLGQMINMESVTALAIMLAVSCLIGLLFFARTRGRLAYWL